jgi:hypothetical protein
MSTPVVKTYADYILPPTIVSKVDVSRLVSEMERLDNELTSKAVRTKAGSPAQPAPILSEQLTDFLVQNQLTFATSKERGELVKQLRLLKEKVPVLTMTFAVVADRESLQQLAQWVRSSIHPQAVITAGLQPALVAGVYVRTPNHVHDLSVRGLLAAQHDNLVGHLETLRGSK